MHFFAFWTIIDYVLYVIKLSMKKVFIQFRQWILIHRKRLIYGALALFIGQICFFNIWWIGIQNEAFASDRESPDQKSSFEKLVTEKVSLFDFFKKSAYTLVYPMMFLAGKLVDNSLVYWEVFKFDIVLWNLWNIMKNFANYGLGLLFIYYLFRYIISPDKNKDKNPKWIIIRSLIAWVWIQASWFLMSVLLDISTIMIYGIWGLPLSILWWAEGGSSEDTDSYVMKNIISVDANDISNTHFYLTNILKDGEGWEQIYISECETFAIMDSDGSKWSEEYILGPKMHYYQDQSWKIIKTEKDLCDYYGNVYKFNNLMGELLVQRDQINVGSEWGNCTNNIERCKTIQSAYNENKNIVKWQLTNDKSKIKPGEVLIPWEKIKDHGYGWDEDNKWIGENKKTQKMSELMKSQDTKTYVWVFTSLYSSLLEAWRWMMPDTDGSIYMQFLSCILTLGHVLAIAIPLAAALLALTMRVAIIWMAIVLSPMIVLLSAFGLLDGKGSNEIFEYFDPKSLIWIIFSPVVICFAISMSTVLVRLIEKMNFQEVKFQNNFEVLWIIQMNLGWFSVWLSKLIVWVMWIAISWFLVWMALSLSKLWKKNGLVDSLHKYASSVIWSAPIIPVPWKDLKWVEFVWARSIFWGDGQSNIFDKMRRKWKSEYDAADDKAVNQFLDIVGGDADEKINNIQRENAKQKENNKFQWYSDWLIGSAQINWNWTTQATTIGEESVSFNDLDNANKDKIIEKINSIPDETRRDAFGSIGEISVWDKKYEYKEHKFVQS